MHTAKLASVRIFSCNLDSAVAFYRDMVGLRLSHHDKASGWAVFEAGSVSVVLEQCVPENSESRELVGRFLGVSFEVSNIATTYADMKAQGVEFTSPPTKQPWGGVLAHFKDLDGNTVTLVESVG